MAYAQPVPGVTDIAPAGQLFAQAPHSIQRSLSQIMAFLFLILKILWKFILPSSVLVLPKLSLPPKE